MNGQTEWLVEARWPGAQAHAVDVWRAHADELGAPIRARCESVLAKDELERADALRSARLRDGFVLARAMVRSVLSRYLEVSPRTICFRRDAHGRPFVDGPPTRIDFNLSHTRGLIVLAVRTALPAGARVGVDVERMRPRIAWERIARRFFSPRESASLESLPAARRLDAFYACWSRKEALVKAEGSGIAGAFRHFAVSVDPGAPPALCAENGPPWKHNEWRLADLASGNGFSACVAASRPAGALRLWDWSGLQA